MRMLFMIFLTDWHDEAVTEFWRMENSEHDF